MGSARTTPTAFREVEVTSSSKELGKRARTPSPGIQQEEEWHNAMAEGVGGSSRESASGPNLGDPSYRPSEVASERVVQIRKIPPRRSPKKRKMVDRSPLFQAPPEGALHSKNWESISTNSPVDDAIEFLPVAQWPIEERAVDHEGLFDIAALPASRSYWNLIRGPEAHLV